MVVLGVVMKRRIVMIDRDACTEDSCDSKTGECINMSKVCDDKDDCTDDTCDIKTGCHFHPIVNCTIESPPDEPEENTEPKTGLSYIFQILEDLLGAKAASVSMPVIISVGVLSTLGIILFIALSLFLLYRAHPPKAEGKYFAL